MLDKFFNLESTTIIANISTFVGMIVSIVAIVMSVIQSRKQCRISQYEARKKLYDFFCKFQDDWLFYIEVDKEIDPLNVALNGFAKEFLSSGSENSEEMMISLTEGYNKQIDKLNELSIYFNLSLKQKNKIGQILRNFQEYYGLLLHYYQVHNKDIEGNEEEIRSQMVNILEKIQVKLLDSV